MANSNERTARSESVPVKEEEEKKIRRKKKERVSPGSFSHSDEETTYATRPLRVLFCARTFGALKNEAFFKSIGLFKTLNSKMEIFKGLFINKKASGVYAYF